MFTADKGVQAAVRREAHLLSLSVFPHCVTLAVEVEPPPPLSPLPLVLSGHAASLTPY